MSVFDNTYAGIPGNHAGKTFDKLLELAPAGSALTDATASAVVEIGTGLVDADLVLDIQTATGANSVALQFSDTADFSTIRITGPSQAIAADYTGRMVIPFRNAHANEKPNGFVRLMPTVGGALTLGAFIGKK